MIHFLALYAFLPVLLNQVRIERQIEAMPSPLLLWEAHYHRENAEKTASSVNQALDEIATLPQDEQRRVLMFYVGRCEGHLRENQGITNMDFDCAKLDYFAIRKKMLPALNEKPVMNFIQTNGDGRLWLVVAPLPPGSGASTGPHPDRPRLLPDLHDIKNARQLIASGYYDLPLPGPKPPP